MGTSEKPQTEALDLKVELVVFGDGERCPMLVDKASGMPLYNPTVWTLSRYRSRSASTMEQALRSAMLLHLWCARRNVDLDERMRTGSFFAPFEIDSIDRAASVSRAQLESVVAREAPVDSQRPEWRTELSAPSDVRFLTRLPRAGKTKSVNPDTRRIRLFYISEYLKWLGATVSFRMGRGGASTLASVQAQKDYDEALLKVLTSLTSRARGKSRANRVSLNPEQRRLLVRVTDPGSPENPWDSPFARLRNRFIVLMLLSLGLRRGELLSMKVRQLEMPQRQMKVVRNHDDKTDPRTRQPQSKTRERMLPLETGLLVLAQQYLKQRATIEAARKHGFLLVSQNGRPMSLNTLTQLFAVIRERFPDLGPITAHVLRHTTNEVFSDEADQLGMSAEAERRLRSEMMGWSERSKMPELYLRRKTRRQAQEASRNVQKRIMRDAARLADTPHNGRVSRG